MNPYAGFWRRFFALILDTFVLSAADLFVHLILRSETSISLMNITIAWLYFALMESSIHQATLGKMAMGIHVTDMGEGRISFARATGRHFAKIISGLTLGIGYIMAAFTERKQALHDMMAGCLVIRNK
jgi:uncharacterized RDD family membrane protein YckC